MASAGPRHRSYARPQQRYVPKVPSTAAASSSSAAAGGAGAPSASSNSGGGGASSASSNSGGGGGGAPSTAKPPPSLTTVLRDPPPAAAAAAGNFLNYLPQDEAAAAGLGALDAEESQSVVDLLNDELSRLLKLPAREFWREVARNESLHAFLDSFLQFRSRWYDFPHRGSRGTVAGVVVGEAELCRRVFMVLYRISSNKDPGAPASESLSVKDHTVLLQEKKLLDFPKLLDICAIYGQENGELTRSLVANGLKSQPKILEKTTLAVSHFLSIVHTMQQRCSSSLEVLISSEAYEDHRKNQLFKDFLEVMDFINDAIVTLDAFADACDTAALYFSVTFETSYGNGELLSTLAQLHDLLIPTLQRGLMLVYTTQEDGAQSGDMLSKIIISLKMLSMRIAKFGWKLLDFCYLNYDLTGDSLLQTITKMFPATVDDPTIRADILVQTLKEINGEVPYVLQQNHNSGTFLQNIERNYNILRRIESLREIGWIFMDDDQFKFLSQIALPAKSWSKVSGVLKSSINEKAPVSEDAVVMESKISQIKDIFPDYGKGFLSACLEAYDHNPEEVIQRILEGTLHEDLLSLDTSLTDILPPKSAVLRRNDKGKGVIVESAPQKSAPPSRNDKGKGVLVESAPQMSAPSSRSDKGKGVLLESTTQSSVLPTRIDITGERDAYGPSSTSLPLFGRFMRKSNDELPDNAVLDSSTAKNAIRSAVLAAEYEYEDEYDDSFDDLGLNVAESGFEEAENLNDRVGSEVGGSERSGSKWASQRKPQFYVKDGKNYSYKVAGSVGVANARDAAVLNQSQRDTIHGLGRGGNIPHMGVNQRVDADTKQQDDECRDEDENPERGSLNSQGRGGGRRGGGGGGRGGRNHYRKDRAMKKHIAGLGGF